VEVSDALLGHLKFLVIANHHFTSTMPRLVPSRLICQ
jgi:hypothetical protein